MGWMAGPPAGIPKAALDGLIPMTRIAKIRIEGWKSLAQMELPLELGPINVVIGANGSGKSNLVSFFKLLGELAIERLQEYIGRSGGADSVLHYGSKVTPEIAAALEIDTAKGVCTYAIRLAYAATDSFTFSGESLDLRDVQSGVVRDWGAIFVPGQKESRLNREAEYDRTGVPQIILDHLIRSRIYHLHDTSAMARIRQAGYIEANQALDPDGGNLAAMLYLYQQTRPLIYRRIVSTIRKIMPMFDDFVLGPQRLNPKNILLNWKKRGSDYLFGPHQLSDGSLRAMALIALFLQPAEDLPALIVVDEPELGLHPLAIEIIAGLMRAASLETQVILTTQSTTLLDHFEPEEIVVVDDHRGHSVFRRLDAETLGDWLEDYSVGQLWQRNVFGGGPLA